MVLYIYKTMLIMFSGVSELYIQTLKLLQLLQSFEIKDARVLAGIKKVITIGCLR